MSRASVTVVSRNPALADVPFSLNNVELLLPKNGKGGAKLAWFMILKNSARNCTLALSEIFLTAMFLNTEKSRLTSPGPTTLLRPALPRRFAQVPAMPGLNGSGVFEGSWGTKPKVWHWLASAGSEGALGSVKQLVLM